MVVSTNTFIKDSILVIKKILVANIVDPISAKRPSNSKFVLSSYPSKDRAARYPIITIRYEGSPEMRKSGMRSSLRYTQVPIQIRVWATNEQQRDELTENVVNQLRSKEFGANSTSDTEGLHDFDLVSSTPVDELGDDGIKSMVMVYQYFFMLGS